MARCKRGQNIHQGLLLPPPLLDWLPEDHLAWFIRDAVESLDVDGLLDSYRVNGKVKANASKHEAMSYARMNKEQERLRREIEAENVEFGPNFSGDELPEELARRKTRLKKIQEAEEARQADAKRAQASERAAKAEGPRELQRSGEPDHEDFEGLRAGRSTPK